jgi:hypothetical protein
MYLFYGIYGIYVFIFISFFFHSEDLRQWLVRYETMLFRQRWDMLTREERELFLAQSHFQFQPIAAKEKLALASALRNGTAAYAPSTMAIAVKAGINIPSFEQEPFFKVITHC